MEKRFFIALLLSFLVLVAYSAIVPKTKPIANKEDMEFSSPVTRETVQAKALIEKPKTQQVKIADKSFNKNELYKFEDGDLVFEFSFKGGYIKSVFDKKLNVELDLKDIGLVPQWSGFLFSKTLLPKGIGFSYLTQEGAEISKTYRIKDDGTIELTISINNITYLKSNSYDILIGALSDSGKTDPISQRYFEGSYQVRNIVSRKSVFGLKNSVNINGKIDWAGLRDRYFCVVFSPQFIVEEGVIKSQDKTPYLMFHIKNEKKPASNSIENVFKVYVGLQDEKRLSAVGLNAERIVNFGFFDLIAKAILFLLTVIHKVVHNWGFAIILVTTLIYFILFPLSYKSMASMKKMQALQPKIEELKIKFKDNPQKLQMATMELYKEEKINPLGGCFPMLLQIPVFFSLYQLLLRLPELRGAGFLWIKDLSSPDRLIALPNALPVIGNEINLLPLLMAGVMFLQQKVSMGSSNATGSTAEQQKMMAIMMPVIFGFLFYKMPSGLVLYWLVNSLLMLIFQWKISIVK
ncbi:MAG: membrane protein insertase YidC [Candidatus Velamenicoccus archaeovorus]